MHIYLLLVSMFYLKYLPSTYSTTCLCITYVLVTNFPESALYLNITQLYSYRLQLACMYMVIVVFYIICSNLKASYTLNLLAVTRLQYGYQNRDSFAVVIYSCKACFSKESISTNIWLHTNATYIR